MDINVVTSDSAQITTVDNFPSEGEEAPAIVLAAHTKASSTDLTTWHRRLGHLNADAVIQMQNKRMVTRMEITDSKPITTPCEPCIKGKHTRAEIQKTTETRADTILGRVFSDVCSRMPTKSHEGYQYFVTWVDDKSRKVFVAGLREKSKVARHLKVFISQAKVETGQCVESLRSDGEGKYISREAQCYLEEKGI
jgi:hypothetical protein